MIAGETLKKAIKDTKDLFGKGEFQGIIRFKYINCAVAKRLNHKRKLPDKFEEKLKKKQEKMEKRRTEYEELKKKFMDVKGAGGKLLKKIKKAEMLYQKAKLEFEVYRDTSEWNLNTSLNSYIDPRLVVEYARRNNIDINRLYSKSLREKFSWAIEENKD
jgi:DNA topoisomerase-1